MRMWMETKLRIEGKNVYFQLRYFQLHCWLFVEYSAVFRNIEFNGHKKKKLTYFHLYVTAISYIIVNICIQVCKKIIFLFFASNKIIWNKNNE